MTITLPPVLVLNETVTGNPIQQIVTPSALVNGTLATFTRDRMRAFLFQVHDRADDVLIVQNRHHTPDGYPRILLAKADPAAETADLSGGVWLRHPRVAVGAFNHDLETRAVLASWVNAFSFVQEDVAQQIRGLRKPQIGAVHAIHAHWTVTDRTATIVMPTGTGKTDTMLAILVSAGCSRVLVVVPTDTLRTQLAAKFLTLGVLKHGESTVLAPQARYPIVCTLKHFPGSLEEVDEIFQRAQVVITTSNIAGQCEPALQDRMAHHCSHLFIDEAHHSEAPTWATFKHAFRGRRIVQFTATPFREDGKIVDGEIIFKYPLAKAQEEGYFQPISFLPVIEFNPARADEAIAEKAIERLRQDFDRGHILMARVENTARAQEVFEIYNRHPEFRAVQLHTGIKSARAREQIRDQIISGQARVVVCVDMLGEGFDLPALKIAAFHDIRKTLAVTLQLAGRFTRTRAGLGNATFVANTADVNVREELRKLYTRDPDWNLLLPQLAERMIDEQVSLQEFLDGFTNFTTEIPLKTVRPATSTVVYRTTCPDWRPANFRAGIHAINSCEQVHHTINHAQHTLVVVTARRVALPWTDVESLFSWDWELYVVIWSPEQNLLYINSSTNTGEYKGLAVAIAGDTAALIRGQDVFRTFSGVKRLTLQNVGLTEQLGRNVRYTGRMGADVESGVTELQRRRGVKSVLSGTGFEGGHKTAVGASRKGRIWSHRRDRVDQLAAWCRRVGDKLLDPTIDPNQVLAGTLEAKALSVRPNAMPLAADWPEEIYTAFEAEWAITIGDDKFSISDLSLNVINPTLAGPLRFEVASSARRIELEIEIYQQGETPNYRVVVLGDERGSIQHGGSTPASLAAFFDANPPVIWFADGSTLEGNHYVELKHITAPFDRQRVAAWDWNDTNIRTESQGPERVVTSIQARVIRELRQGDYRVIFDDDDAGEAADVVAIRLLGDEAEPREIQVEFYHCKFSGEDTPGARIKDLYEVCGQAQKSTAWMSSSEKRTDLFTHLMRREAGGRERGRATRYEVGNDEIVNTIREVSRLCSVSLKIFIVQPGMSRAAASDQQLTLLSVTENYLTETYQLPFGVIAST